MEARIPELGRFAEPALLIAGGRARIRRALRGQIDQ
jgi:hypothetical protein